jgi:hypothetical protein
MPKRKPTIAELEAILNSDKEPLIFIQPDGSVHTRRGRGSKLWKRTQQPLTAKAQNGHENLGSGSY